MTEVVILKNIPGLRRGAIVAHEPWLDNHVQAGNAKVLPNEHEAWEGEPASAAPPVLQAASTGSYAPDDVDALEADGYSEEE